MDIHLKTLIVLLLCIILTHSIFYYVYFKSVVLPQYFLNYNKLLKLKFLDHFLLKMINIALTMYFKYQYNI